MTIIFLPFLQVKSLELSLTSLSFFHIPYWQIQLAFPSEYIQEPITSHQLYCHHHELSHQILLPGLLLLPPNYLPSSIPCSSTVNSQNSRQSNIVLFFKSSQVYSPHAQIFHWFFSSLKMKAEDVRVASGTMYPLAPMHLPLQLRPSSLLLICFHRCVSETHHHAPP